MGGHYPIGTSFLYAFSEDNVWSATLREVDWTGTIVIVFDGIVVPDKYKDGSMRGPVNMEFINLPLEEQLDAPGTKLKLRLPEATDDEKRKAWAEKRKAYQEEQNKKRSEADDALFKTFNIGQHVLWKTSSDPKNYSVKHGMIKNMNRAKMTVDLDDEGWDNFSIYDLKKVELTPIEIMDELRKNDKFSFLYPYFKDIIKRALGLKP